MELMCMFDLPSVTAKQKRNYRLFRRLLAEHGFMMLEESVYCRLIPSGNPLLSLSKTIRESAPPEGTIILLPITEKQFENMEFISGERPHIVVDSRDAVVEL